MGTLVRMGLLAGLGGLAYKIFHKQRVDSGSNADAAPVHSSGVVRNAGPEEQETVTKYDWDKVDEQSDESFPASDPPATY